MVKIGEKAPDFALPCIAPGMANGTVIKLSDLYSKAVVVVAFYPADETPGCTAEACSFRDKFETFKKVGATVVGISENTIESHIQFAQHHRLPYILAADVDNKARKAFDVPRSMLGLMAGRVTYVIDRAGIVRHIFNSQMNSTKHITESLAIIEKLNLAQPHPPTPTTTLPATIATTPPAPTTTTPSTPPTTPTTATTTATTIPATTTTTPTPTAPAPPPPSPTITPPVPTSTPPMTSSAVTMPTPTSTPPTQETTKSTT